MAALDACVEYRLTLIDRSQLSRAEVEFARVALGVLAVVVDDGLLFLLLLPRACQPCFLLRVSFGVHDALELTFAQVCLVLAELARDDASRRVANHSVCY